MPLIDKRASGHPELRTNCVQLNEAWTDLIAILPEAGSADVALVAFERLVAQAGYSRHMILDLPLSLQLGFASHGLRDNWPESFRLHYFERRLFLSDPAMIASYRETGPFFWTDAVLKYARTPEQRAVSADLASAGMQEGLVLPFVRGASWRSIISLARNERERPAPGAVTVLHLAAHHLGACFLASPSLPDKETLTAREREVLRWLAMGKTALETALILELAKTTVDRHLTNARRKLSARTNAHAVALLMGRQLLLEG